ncbi:MAG: phosphonatase-like hydrolase [Woeseiaceae bacterium]|nr:phosphonatase-like hydrolase [Woeseiaceae bacterium]
MRPIDLVVFDMVGTTVAASDRIPEAFTKAFENQGIRLSQNDIRSVRGRSKTDAIRELLTTHRDEFFADATTDNVYESFKRFLLDGYRAGRVEPIDGAAATFDWCRANGIGVALTTGFDRELATRLVERLGWRNRIETLVCNDDVARGRPAPDLILKAMQRLNLVDVARVASVGDTVSDLQAGANAGTGFNIGVLSGAHSREQLRQAPHTALIASVAELPEFLQNS